MRSTMADGIIKVASSIGRKVEGEEEWNDGIRSEIAQILIWHGEKIHAIQTQYYENENLVLSPLHGSTTNATCFNAVQFDIGRDEYITEMNCACSEEGYVTSLTIRTNKGYCGSFGESSNNGRGVRKAFKFDLGKKYGPQFSGFWGSANAHGLTSIGICLKPATSVADLTKRSSTAKRFKSTTEETDEFEETDLGFK